MENCNNCIFSYPYSATQLGLVYQMCSRYDFIIKNETSEKLYVCDSFSINSKIDKEIINKNFREVMNIYQVLTRLI